MARQPRCGNDPNTRLLPGDLAGIAAFRQYLADRKAAMDPLIVRWNRTVIHPDPTKPGDPTIVCCLTETGKPVALLLDDELREALGLQLVDPNPED